MKIRRLGYACINDELNSRKDRVSSTRGIQKKTFIKEGSAKVAELSLQNLKDLKKILKWNADNGVFLFRIGSGLFPWKSEWEWGAFEWTEHKAHLKDIGDYAKATDQRLTFHPGPFNKLCSFDKKVLHNTVSELEMHDDIFNLMGFAPSFENTINIHLGAAYGNKKGTAMNWVKNYDYLSDSIKKRLTIENDDKKALYTTEDLYYLVYEKCGVPIMFDFHHERLNPSKNWGEMKAVEMAISTWPDDVTPLFHWSESRRDEMADLNIREAAHSDYTYGPLPAFKTSRPIDLMIEAKKKEKNLNTLTYHNGDLVHGK